MCNEGHVYDLKYYAYEKKEPTYDKSINFM